MTNPVSPPDSPSEGIHALHEASAGDPQHEETIAVYQLARQAASGFDTILVTLLTQGNAFTIAILSVPLVASLDNYATALLMSFALLLSMFLCLANYLYWSLLARSVKIAEDFEEQHLTHLPATHHLTTKLDDIPLSAGRGSQVLYLLLPGVWSIAAIVLGCLAMARESNIHGWGFLFFALLLVAVSLLVFAFFIRRPTPGS